MNCQYDPKNQEAITQKTHYSAVIHMIERVVKNNLSS